MSQLLRGYLLRAVLVLLIVVNVSPSAANDADAEGLLLINALEDGKYQFGWSEGAANETDTFTPTFFDVTPQRVWKPNHFLILRYAWKNGVLNARVKGKEMFGDWIQDNDVGRFFLKFDETLKSASGWWHTDGASEPIKRWAYVRLMPEASAAVVSTDPVALPAPDFSTTPGIPFRKLDPSSDAYECNDSPSDARDLMSAHQRVNNLSIHASGDADWFRWTAANTGLFTVTLQENNAGQLDLSVFRENGDGTLEFLLRSMDADIDTQSVSISAEENQKYLILVLSADGQSNDNYSLEVDGDATDGTHNRSPEANNIRISTLESRAVRVDVLANDIDPDGDPLVLYPHSDPLGRATVANGLVHYLPATSVTEGTLLPLGLSHVFTYVADDGRGGRAKGTVTIDIDALRNGTAFEGAEGFGAFSTGGRNGDVYHVTSLENDGPGTLRDAIESKEPSRNRIIVFDIGGVIHVRSIIKFDSGTTIAGETAPGPGITVFGAEVRTRARSALDNSRVRTRDVIIRYVRFRLPKGRKEEDALTATNADNVIIDHCSLSWGNDGTIDIYDSDKVTLQWSIISETLEPHSLATLSRSESPAPVGSVTLHHNLWAHNNRRNPWIQDNMNADVMNNVIYNWGGLATLIGTGRTALIPPRFIGPEFIGNVRANVVKNYYIAGPDSKSNSNPQSTTNNLVIRAQTWTNLASKTIVHLGRNDSSSLSNNFGDLDKDAIHNGEQLKLAQFGTIVEKSSEIEWSVPSIPVTVTSAEIAYMHVLEDVGASLVRDATDQRIIDDVRTRNPSAQIISNPPDPPDPPQ